MLYSVFSISRFISPDFTFTFVASDAVISCRANSVRVLQTCVTGMLFATPALCPVDTEG
ncbi:hypothetical protein X965_17810 [Morganella sp. EGD-HP17]|nr:hypothetical protein X965_17810 [Morganella sp. EGD-HP17]